MVQALVTERDRAATECSMSAGECKDCVGILADIGGEETLVSEGLMRNDAGIHLPRTQTMKWLRLDRERVVTRRIGWLSRKQPRRTSRWLTSRQMAVVVVPGADKGW